VCDILMSHECADDHDGAAAGKAIMHLIYIRRGPIAKAYS
jgi:hypothetical protein